MKHKEIFLENLIKEIESGSAHYDEDIKIARKEAHLKFWREYELAKQALKEKQDIMQFRKEWSCFIKICVAFLLLINIIVLICIGLNWLKFPKESNYVHDVLIGNFLEIVGMAYIVVKFLFPQPHNSISQKTE